MAYTHFAFLAVQVLTFAAFTWAALAFFKVAPEERNNPKIKAMRGLGLFFIIVDVYCSYHLLGAPSEASLLLGIFVFGLSLLTFSGAIYVNKVQRLNFAFTAGGTSSLVKSGPYKYIRHPFYLSYFLSWIAVPLALQNVWLSIPIFVMGWFYVTAAKNEEQKFLAGAFATEYAAYRAKTGMFVPRFRGGR